jgi:hypothetical protein
MRYRGWNAAITIHGSPVRTTRLRRAWLAGVLRAGIATPGGGLDPGTRRNTVVESPIRTVNRPSRKTTQHAPR